MAGRLTLLRRPAAAAAAAVVLAAVLAAGAQAARARFPGNVCALLTAKQVATIPGVTAACTKAPSMQGPGSTIYTGNWAGKTPTSAHLQVTVSRYTDSGALALAVRNLRQGLTGPPRRVKGIGSGAFEAYGASAADLRFVVGKYVVGVTATSVPKTHGTTAAVEALAKVLAVRLQRAG